MIVPMIIWFPDFRRGIDIAARDRHWAPSNRDSVGEVIVHGWMGGMNVEHNGPRSPNAIHYDLVGKALLGQEDSRIPLHAEVKKHQVGESRTRVDGRDWSAGRAITANKPFEGATQEYHIEWVAAVIPFPGSPGSAVAPIL